MNKATHQEQVLLSIKKGLDCLESYVNKKPGKKFGTVSGQEFTRHGPGYGWFTITVMSAIANIAMSQHSGLINVSKQAQQLLCTYLFPGLLSLMGSEGDVKVGWGWGYVDECHVPLDPDDTAQAIEALRKCEKILISQGIVTTTELENIYKKSEKLMLSRQNADGGICAYLQETVTKMGYSGEGWSSSHPEISAIVYQQIHHDTKAKEQIGKYLKKISKKYGYLPSYWFVTPYNGYRIWPEPQNPPEIPLTHEAIDIAFFLLGEAKRGRSHQDIVEGLVALQNKDGSFPPTLLHRLPRPHMLPEDLFNGKVQAQIRPEIGRHPDGPTDAPLQGRSILGTSYSLMALVTSLELLYAKTYDN